MAYFQKVIQNGFTNNQAFWYAIKQFLTNKRFLISDSISLTQENETMTDKKKVVHSFNSLCKYYKNNIR